MKRQTNKSSVQESLQDNFNFRNIKRLSLSMSPIPLLLLLATVVASTSSSGDPKRRHPSPEERERRQGGNRSYHLQSYTRTDHIVPRPARNEDLLNNFKRLAGFKRTFKDCSSKPGKKNVFEFFFALTSKI